ncbi:hypothetical protein VTN77DRAFT_1343 [Rasamsonia byssochlamydoides]|uniref:uncharacterized protein n=1 Tax=Rasamsonia byssochlamydoides TaxID=89139 RepID=UPI0037436F0F
MEARLPPRLTTSLSVSSSISISFSFSTILLLLTAFVLSPALAQDVHLLPTAASSAFPACALSCTTLQQAQDGCVPPAAPVSNQATYVNCFCQSALLTTLHTTPDSVCDTSCTSESDRQLLMTWYNNYCSSGGQDTGTPTTTTTAASAATTTASTADTPGPPSWMSTHWRWVLMVIVLFVGFTTIGLVGTWYKRRYDEKHQGLYHGEDNNRLGQASGKNRSTGFLFGSNQHSNSSPGASGSAIGNNPEMWGPHQATVHTRVAPVDDPGFVASSSRTDISSAHTLVGPGPGPGSTSRNGGVNPGSGSRLHKEPVSE